MDDVYNLYYLPTTYFDGGYRVKNGGSSGEGEGPYRTFIEEGLERPVADLDFEVSLTWLGDARLQVDVMACYNTLVNEPPDLVAIFNGPDEAEIGQECHFQSLIADPEQNQHYLRWAWGQGDTTEWLGPYNNAQVVSAYHTWWEAGTYTARVQGKDIWDAEGPWSDPHEITILPEWVCGDVNGDGGGPNIVDLTYLSAYLFAEGPAPPTPEAADVNGDEAVNIVDLTAIVEYLFNAGPEPTCGQ